MTNQVAINTGMISALRERTGAGLVECKKALQETNGDIEKATEILRQKGIASAANKAGKIAAEGVVLAKTNENNTKGVIIELNSQTDFVAKNEKFQSLLQEIVSVALQKDLLDLESLKNAKTQTGETIAELISLKTAEIGEKIDLRRFIVFVAEKDQTIYQYTHPIGSRIAVLLKLQGNNAQSGKDLCMHIAAIQPAPEYIKREEISSEVIENEKRIELGKEDLANKPKEIAEKIVNGRVEKVLAEKVLLEQLFIKDSSKKIKDILSQNKINVLQFARFNLGEGIEKIESNFKEEVAAQMKKTS